MLHLQLMIAILMVVVIRLVLYIDLIFTDKLGHILVNPEGKTINTMVIFIAFSLFQLFCLGDSVWTDVLHARIFQISCLLVDVFGRVLLAQPIGHDFFQ